MATEGSRVTAGDRFKALFPEVRYGVQRIKVGLADGRTIPGVEVEWGDRILGAVGYDTIPFGPQDVIAVEDDAGWAAPR